MFSFLHLTRLLASGDLSRAGMGGTETGQSAEALTPAVDLVQPFTDVLQAAGGSGTLILLVTIFVLAVFVGVEIITKIPPTLHTPLMSGSNAISGITLVGAILESGKGGGFFATMLGLIAVVLATVNVVGGFVVTDRMLSMFKSKKK